MTMTHANDLRDCWAIALDLDVDDVGEESNFFNIGGDSVQAIRLSELAREHDLKLDVETIFNYPDFKDMLVNSEKVVTRESSGGPPRKQLDFATIQACADSCGVEPELIEDIFPTLRVQKGFMDGHIQSGAFMMQLVFELQGTRDTNAVCLAFDTIRAKNQVLRTRFVEVDSAVLQVAIKDRVIWHRADDLKKYLATDSKMWMGYGQVLIRHALVQETEKTYVVWTAHHSVMDGWTRRLLLDDLESCLADPVTFTARPDRPPFKNFVDYQQSLDAEEAGAFFRKYLSGIPNTKSLYTVPDGHSLSNNHSITREVSVDRPTKSVITLSNLAQAAFALAIAQITGSRGTTLYTIRGGRAVSMPGVESIMGPVVSGIPQHIQLPPEKPVSTVLRGIQDTATRMLKYEAFALDNYKVTGKNLILFNWYPFGSDPFSRMAKFSVGEDEASLRVVEEVYPNPRSLLGCIFAIYDNGDRLKVTTKFDDQLLKESLIEKVLDLFAAKLERICAGQDMSVESLMA